MIDATTDDSPSVFIADSFVNTWEGNGAAFDVVDAAAAFAVLEGVVAAFGVIEAAAAALVC